MLHLDNFNQFIMPLTIRKFTKIVLSKSQIMMDVKILCILIKSQETSIFLQNMIMDLVYHDLNRIGRH